MTLIHYKVWLCQGLVIKKVECVLRRTAITQACHSEGVRLSKWGCACNLYRSILIWPRIAWIKLAGRVNRIIWSCYRIIRRKIQIQNAIWTYNRHRCYLAARNHQIKSKLILSIWWWLSCLNINDISLNNWLTVWKMNQSIEYD